MKGVDTTTNFLFTKSDIVKPTIPINPENANVNKSEAIVYIIGW